MAASSGLLREQLPQELSPAGTERGSDGELPRAAHTAREQQVRHVRTRHEQHKSYDACQHQ